MSRPCSRPSADTRAGEAPDPDLVDPDTVAYYPSWETLPHERLSPRSDTVVVECPDAGGWRLFVPLGAETGRGDARRGP